MIHKKRHLLFIFSIVSSLTFASGGGENDNKNASSTEDDNEDSTEEVSDESLSDVDLTDSTSYVMHPEDYITGEEDFMPTYEDSLALIPSHELYGVWDTLKIHPYSYEVADISETSYIDLCSHNSCGYVHPFNGRVTSDFGPRWNRWHYGIDIDLETGDYVGVAFDGVVRIVKYSKTYGNVVVVRHENGLETFYAHLSKAAVNVGQKLSAGDLVGYGGNTGNSTGSHLHFEVRYLGKAINPNSIISFDSHLLNDECLNINQETFSYIAEAKKLAAMYRVHTVRRGDTLSHIAKKYRTTVTSLCKKNKIKRNSTLRIGQKIRI